VTTLLLDDALKPATPLIVPLISGIASLSASSSSKEDTKAKQLTKWGVGWHGKWTWLLCSSHLQRLHKCKQVLRAQSHVDSTVSRCTQRLSTDIWRRAQGLDDSDGTAQGRTKQRLTLSVIQSPVTCVTTCTSHYVHKKITQTYGYTRNLNSPY